MIFKKNPMKHKQPQEDYCSNHDCYNKIARFSWEYGLVDDELLKHMNYYCGNCIKKRKYK